MRVEGKDDHCHILLKASGQVVFGFSLISRFDLGSLFRKRRYCIYDDFQFTVLFQTQNIFVAC
jgi:hypothetical protein